MKKKQIYLDYSATTKVDKAVLNYFNYFVKKFYANSNSNHLLGNKTREIINKSIKSMASYLGIKTSELIFTSGATEANNTILKGVYNGKRNQIITTKLEHASVNGSLGYLQKQNYKINFVPLKKDGIIDLTKLACMINEKTLLVSIGAVDSELGIRQPIEEIGVLLKQYPDVYFHSDITQCLGKDLINLDNVDLASFSGHKLYCFKGIGAIIKKNHVKMHPLIHGGKSMSPARGGTPFAELIVALNKSFDLFKNDVGKNKNYVKKLNIKIKNHLQKYPNIKVNSTDKSIPHILNLSFLNKKPTLIQKYFANHDIFISTQTACAIESDISKNVFEVTKDEKRAATSVRISISSKTTKKDIRYFLKILDKLMREYHEIN